MADTMQQPVTQNDKGDDFEKRHSKELGVKRFATIQAIYLFVPFLAAAVGGLIGYAGLAKPVTKLFPKWSKAAGVTEAGVGKLGKSFDQLLMGKSVREVFSEFTPDPEKLEKIAAFAKDEALSRGQKYEKIIETLDIKTPDVPKTVRGVTGGITGFVGLLGGSIAIGYDQWRKNESARLAAEEVNRDIAGMELFKPSDSELVAENKRLRTMVAALPDVDMGTAKREGMVEEKQKKAAAI